MNFFSAGRIPSARQRKLTYFAIVERQSRDIRCIASAIKEGFQTMTSSCFIESSLQLDVTPEVFQNRPYTNRSSVYFFNYFEKKNLFKLKLKVNNLSIVGCAHIDQFLDLSPDLARRRQHVWLSRDCYVTVGQRSRDRVPSFLNSCMHLWN